MVRLVVMLAAIALVAAACDPEGGTVGPTPSPVAPTHVEQENFNEVVLTGASRSAEAGLSGTYTLRATVDGTTIDGTVTWYQRGAQMRADFGGKVAGQQQSAMLLNAPNYPAQNALYECRQTEQRCALRNVTEGSPDVLPSLLAFEVLNVSAFASGLNFYDESARPIIGQQTLCFVGRSEAVPAGAIDHGEVCLTDDGLPLLVTAAGAGRTMSLTATSVPDGVSDSDFDLPYAVQGQ